jgi:DNA-binding Lrp family transcriptional regulator
VIELIKAYLMCKAHSGRVRDVLNKIGKFFGVIKADLVYGEYDVIAIIQAKNILELDFITQEIRHSIPSIILTSTMIIAREYRGKDYRSKVQMHPSTYKNI